ncbi:phasin, PhaP [Amylibacter sp. IMCC11727]|uniref:phasin, PhaP n=1 Tax=Amylibacter sp. IMCC11727 TaxID=3039851 RepID=UPI00244DD372|nr:phasin, PhaP [Amylibacter sp. IMCC11727]WGI22782.1 phasin, PhaP [Amylibacter sp. IMCC11727]
MAKQDFDFAKATEEFFGAFKMDTKMFDDAAKNAAEFNVKLGKIALEAAKKNAELTNAWTAEALKSVEAANKIQKDPSAYATVASDFASAQAQAMPEKLSAYAEVAKAAQLEAVELFVAAGKDVQAEVVAATKDVAAKAKAA